MYGSVRTQAATRTLARVGLLSSLVVLIGWASPPRADAVLPQQQGAVDLLSQANVQLDAAVSFDLLGFAVADAGDVNGDGLDDVVMGADNADNNGRLYSGSAYVIFGRREAAALDLAVPLGANGFRIDGAVPYEMVGTDVAGVGDVNGDGLDDVAIGAPAASHNGRNLSGSVYVVFGRTSTTNIDLAALGTAGFRVDGAKGATGDEFAPGDGAGVSVAGAGDFNGDGLADVIAGANHADGNERKDAGSAYVVFGKTDSGSIDLAASAGRALHIDGAAAGNWTGQSVDGIGDVNGDGLADVVVGAPTAAHNGDKSGSAYVVFGGAQQTGVDLASLGARGFRIDGAPADSHEDTADMLGYSVAGAGDVNGDGRPDVIAGAPVNNANGRALAGSAYVVFGRTDTTTVDVTALGTAGFRIDGATGAGEGDDSGIGYDVAGAGDINGDGRADVIVGAPTADDNGRKNSGSAWVVFGRSETSSIDLAGLGAGGFHIGGGAAGDTAGISVGGGGDFNGDARPDAIIGAPLTNNHGRIAAGSTYVIYGFGAPSVAYAPLVAQAGRAITPLHPTVSRTGQASFSVSPPLPDGLSLDPATGVVSGSPAAVTPPAAHTVTMNDLAGSAATQLEVVVEAPAPGPGPGGPPAPGPGPTVDRTAPVLSALALSPRRFRAAARGPAVRAAVGTRIRYRLSEAASVTFTMQRALPGRRARGGRCRPPRRAPRDARRCTRYAKVRGSFTHRGAAGANALSFRGRLRKRRLGAGSYRLRAVAVDPAGNRSKPKHTRLRIVRR